MVLLVELPSDLGLWPSVSSTLVRSQCLTNSFKRNLFMTYREMFNFMVTCFTSDNWDEIATIEDTLMRECFPIETILLTNDEHGTLDKGIPVLTFGVEGLVFEGLEGFPIPSAAIPSSLYIIQMEGCTEPHMFGPYATDEERVKEVNQFDHNGEDVYCRLDITNGIPSVSPFMNYEIVP